VTISPRDHAKAADPGHGLVVSVAHGTLTSVTATAGGGDVPGDLNVARTAWHSRWALVTDTRYTVRATAVDADGLAVTRTSSFRTLAPQRTFSTTIFEGYRKTYGVGMPIILDFSAPIENREAVERALEVRTSTPVVGAWLWDGDRRLYFRPRDYWPEHTRVHFVGHLDGVEGSPGVFGVHTLTQSFSIGRSLIAVADTRTHHVRIYLGGKLFGNWPMSSGKPGDDTPNGTYLSMEKANPEEMVGPGYDILVPWSVRFTLSGDFLHDAFWSVGEQGFENVSHGCVNLSPENAQTYYELSVPGDPVTIQGSPRAGDWGNGWTVWFLSWSEVLSRSATHRAVKAGPDGSTFVGRAQIRPSRARPPLRTSAPHNADAA
jgi:lipoprotein-anchoring transpeptidase ErfK/SrfK